MSEPQTIRTWFLRHAVAWMPFLLRHYDLVTGRFHPREWNARCNNCIYALAYLYATEHPENPYWGNRTLLRAALRGGLVYSKEQTEAGGWVDENGFTVLDEWTAYFLTETAALIGSHLAAGDLETWKQTIARWAEAAIQRPFALTSPAHDAWKCAALYRA